MDKADSTDQPALSAGEACDHQPSENIANSTEYVKPRRLTAPRDRAQPQIEHPDRSRSEDMYSLRGARGDLLEDPPDFGALDKDKTAYDFGERGHEKSVLAVIRETLRFAGRSRSPSLRGMTYEKACAQHTQRVHVKLGYRGKQPSSPWIGEMLSDDSNVVSNVQLRTLRDYAEQVLSGAWVPGTSETARQTRRRARFHARNEKRAACRHLDRRILPVVYEGANDNDLWPVQNDMDPERILMEREAIEMVRARVSEALGQLSSLEQREVMLLVTGDLSQLARDRGVTRNSLAIRKHRLLVRMGRTPTDQSAQRAGRTKAWQRRITSE